MNSLLKSIQYKFEKNYVRLMGWKNIPHASDKLVNIDIKKYKGKKIEIDNVLIEPGDTVAEMHINNLNINKIDNSFKTILHSYQNEMLCLIEARKDYEEFKDIKALYAITVLHPLMKRLGYTCFPINNSLYRGYLKWWEHMLKNSFSSGTTKNKEKKNDPMKVWISMDKINQQFLTPKKRRK